VCAHQRREGNVELVALTKAQSARIDTLSGDCVVVGMEEGCPLVRQGGGGVERLERDGHFVRAEHGVRSVTPYLEVGAS
jgi:hypothetical protein